MKPFTMDFITDRRAAFLWIILWIFNAALCLTVGIYSKNNFDQDYLLENDLAALQRRLVTINQASPAKPEPRADDSARVSKRLQTLLDPAFNTVENISLPGVQLTHFQIDLMTDSVRLNYRMADIGQTTDISAMLNDGNPNRPWHIETANTAPAAGSQAASINGTSPAQAAWSARLSSLN